MRKGKKRGGNDQILNVMLNNMPSRSGKTQSFLHAAVT